jgi:tetratricopeptide (TPR) repeat protein
MCGSAMRSRNGRRAPAALLALLLALMAVSAPAHAQRPGEAEDESAQFVVEARAALRAGRPKDAARSLDQAISLNPRRIEAYVLRGAVYQALREYEPGIALMQRARQLAPGSNEVQARLGALLVRASERAGGSASDKAAQLADGVALLEAVVRRDKQRHEAFLALGQSWRRRGEHRRAIVALGTYLFGGIRPQEAASQDADLLIELADSYLRARLPGMAAALLRDRLPEALARVPGGERDSHKAARRRRIELLQALVAVALDCSTAEPQLAALKGADAREAVLLRGRCALERGDLETARRLAERYLAESPTNLAAGLGLRGEVHAEQGQLPPAREKFEQAIAALRDAKAAPAAERVWQVRLAALPRRAGQLAEAIDGLRRLGPPAAPELDPLWWRELGRAYLLRGERAELVALRAQLAAVLTSKLEAPQDDELFAPRRGLIADERLWVLLGEIDLKLGNAGAASTSLGTALSLRGSEPVRALLRRAQEQERVERSAAMLAAGDAAGVDRLLGSMTPSASGPPSAVDVALWRNLGIARLMLGDGPRAAAVLERAGAVAPSAVSAMLLGRAYALSKEREKAMRAYDQAAKLATGDERVEVAIDRASFELAIGRPSVAVAMLEAVDDAPGLLARGARTSSLAERRDRALSTARHAAGAAELRDGRPARALDFLREGARADAPLALRCDYALAALASQGVDAMKVMKDLGKLDCPFFGQSDGLAVRILTLAAESETPAKAKAALGRLLKLAPRQTAEKALWAAAVRVAGQNAASEAYRLALRARDPEARRRLLALARGHLRRAKAAQASFGDDEVALGEAVIDVAENRAAAAVPVLERLAPRMPEAEVHLGLAYDRLGDRQDDQRALLAWRRARRAGARAPQLLEWIKAKERIEENPVEGMGDGLLRLPGERAERGGP